VREWCRNGVLNQ